jgi:hypothetical protein
LKRFRAREILSGGAFSEVPVTDSAINSGLSLEGPKDIAGLLRGDDEKP